jgi:hypothetical protein
MNASTATLGFSETVVAASVQPTKLVIQSSAGSSIAKRLTGGAKAQLDDITVVVTLLNADMNALKEETNLATSLANSFIRADQGAVLDKYGNPLAVVNNGSAVPATGFNQDLTSPELSSFELNLSTGHGYLVLSFSETVNGARFKPDALTLQSVANTSATSRVLSSSATLVAVENSPVLTVALTSADANAIKNTAGLGSAKASTFLPWQEPRSSM